MGSGKNTTDRKIIFLATSGSQPLDGVNTVKMISAIHHELEVLIDGLLQYFRREHNFVVAVRDLEQDFSGVGAICNGTYLVLNEKLLAEDPGMALYALLHLAGHSQQLRAGDDRAIRLAYIKHDYIDAHPDEGQDAIRQNTELDIEATKIGWGFFLDAKGKGYIHPDLIQPEVEWIEHYFALDMAQYRRCIEEGPIPLSGGPMNYQVFSISRWPDLESPLRDP